MLPMERQNQVDVDNPPIAVIGEAGPSGLQAGQFQPPAKKRRIQDAYEVEDDGQKSYNISCRESKSFKGNSLCSIEKVTCLTLPGT